MQYTTTEVGTPCTTDYKIYINDERGPISSIHDVPLYPENSRGICNMIVEIPRWTNAKMEMCKEEPLNPIKQDVKNGKLRYVANCFPFHGYIWNYGALPQTWEHPSIVDEFTMCRGDNDPLDVLEIGCEVAKVGSVLQVKILGALALIDEGEMDWKIIAINVKDPLSEVLDTITDVDLYCPGLLKASVEWFVIYKIPDGKKENHFAFNGEPRDKEFTEKLICSMHASWRDLVLGDDRNDAFSCVNVSIEGSVGLVETQKAKEVVERALQQEPRYPAQLPVNSVLNRWHYVVLS